MRKGRDMAKVVCVLYDDPINGYPTSYARDGLPEIHTYPDGQPLPTPKAIDFTPGHLLASVPGELGLRQSLESQGHTLDRSEGHTSDLPSLLPPSYRVFYFKKITTTQLHA